MYTDRGRPPAGRGLEADRQLALAPGLIVEPGQEAAEGDDRPAVAHRPDLLQEPDGGEGMLGAPGAEVVLEGVEHGGPRRGRALQVVLAAEDLADGVAGEPGEPGDGAGGVALAGQVADVHEVIH